MFTKTDTEKLEQYGPKTLEDTLKLGDISTGDPKEHFRAYKFGSRNSPKPSPRSEPVIDSPSKAKHSRPASPSPSRSRPASPSPSRSRPASPSPSRSRPGTARGRRAVPTIAELNEDQENPPSILQDILDATLVNRFGTKLTGHDVLSNKIIGLFFSASWSPPCHDFLPKLKHFYKELCLRCAPFEIVLMSCDRDKDDMMDYFSSEHGNWWALHNNKLVMVMRQHFNVHMVPKLVIVRTDGTEITNRGRKEVTEKNLSAFIPWYEAADVKAFSPSKLNVFEIGLKEEDDRTARRILREDHTCTEWQKKHSVAR